MNIGARTGVWSGGAKAIPAIWVGSDNCWFDLGYNTYGKNTKVITQFYLKKSPSASNYIVGSSGSTANTRADPCVIAVNFWYATFGSVAYNSSDARMLYQNTPIIIGGINTVEWVKNDINKTHSYKVNGKSVISGGSFSSENGISLNMFRRNHALQSYITYAHDVGVVSCEIYRDETLVKSFKPALVNGIACLWDEVGKTNLYKAGGVNPKYIPDVSKDMFEL